MGRRNPMMRLFVGAYPPPEQAGAMLDLLGGVPLPDHRPTRAEQVHLTLQFIGDRHERELEDVIESVSRSASGIGPVVLTPRAIISLPERGLARLVALETDAPPGLLEIQRRLAHRLADPRRRGKERFTPHLTLCRFRQDERMERLEAPVELPAFEVGEVRLMQSVLLPAGAEHRLVSAVRLDSPQ